MINETRKTPQMALDEQNKAATEKWFAGDAPTRGETLAQISKVYAQDQQAGLNAYKSFLQLSQDPSSSMYSPYMGATNTNTRNSFAAYGVDASSVNDDWFTANAWMKNYNRTGESGNILGTAKSATKAQNMASLYADLYDQEQTTQKAETEWEALKDVVAYWTSRADLNLTDDEILGKINWSNYPTLKKMDEAALSGAPVYTTRAVGYDKDLLKGVIYQTRNNGGTGDLLMDSASYYGGQGNQYKKNDATRARLTYGSDSYNPYVVSGTANDLGLYFGEGSFDREWLNANANILNGTDETAKKNYHKVQEAVALTEKANGELDKLNAQIDQLVSKGISTDIIMGNVERGLEDGTYPTLGKLQDSILTGELLNTASAISFDMGDLRKSIDARVNESKAPAATTAPAGRTEAESKGVMLVADNGSPEEIAFFEGMSGLNFEDQVRELWLAYEDPDLVMDEDFLARGYAMLADTFNKKWASEADKIEGGRARLEKLAVDLSNAQAKIQGSPEYQRLVELGYTGEWDDYKGVYGFLDTIDETEYDALIDPLQTMYSDLAQAEYEYDWNAEERDLARAYNAEYSALETYRRRARINDDASISKILRKSEDYAITDTLGVTAADVVDEVMKANEGVSSDAASAHVAAYYEDEKARLEKEVASLESAGYKGRELEAKKNKLAAANRMLSDLATYNLQYEPDYAQKVEAGKDLVTKEAYNVADALGINNFDYKVSDDGKVSVSYMVDYYMDDAEKERLQYLAASDPAAAREYLASLTDPTYGVLPVRHSQAVSGKWEEFAESNPVVANVAAVGLAPLRVVDTGYSAVQGIKGEEINPYGKFMGFTNAVGATRAQTLEDIEEATKDSPFANAVGKFAYNVATSMADSLVSGSMGGLGLPTMVLSAASDTIQNAVENGANTTEALLLGGITAIAEYVTEKIPFDALDEALKGGKKAVESIIVDILKTGTQDAFGEGLSEIASNLADQWIMRDRSGHAALVEKYVSEGMSPEDAERAAIRDEWKEVGIAALSGFVSSAGSMAFANIGNYTTKKQKGKTGVPLTMQKADAPVAETAAPVATEQQATEQVAPTEQQETTATAPVATQKDNRIARKMSALAVMSMRKSPSMAGISSALMSENDGSSTVAKAATLDLQRIFKTDTARVLADVFGAAYEAGLTDEQVTGAIKNHLAKENTEGVAQIEALADGGVSTGKIKEFVAQSEQSEAKYSVSQARAILVMEYERAELANATTFTELDAAGKAQTKAKENFTKAQQALGKIQKQQAAAVTAMQKAMEEYNASFSNPNGNVQTSIQAAYLNAIDVVANFNSALEAASRRAQEAKAKFDGAIQNYKEVGAKILNDVRAKAESAVDQAMKMAEDKTVNDVMAELKKVPAEKRYSVLRPEAGRQTAQETVSVATETAPAPQHQDKTLKTQTFEAEAIAEEIDTEAMQRQAVEQLREMGLLDELTDLNREIETLTKSIAGNWQNNKIARPLRKMLNKANAMRTEIVDTVRSLVNEEVARMRQANAEAAQMDANISEALATKNNKGAAGKTVSSAAKTATKVTESAQTSSEDAATYEKLQEAYVTSVQAYEKAREDARRKADPDPDNPFSSVDWLEVNRLTGPFEAKVKSAEFELMDFAKKLKPTVLNVLPIKKVAAWGNDTVGLEDGILYRYALVNKSAVSTKGTKYENDQQLVAGYAGDGDPYYSKDPDVFEVTPEGEVVEGYWFNRAKNNKGAAESKKRAADYGFKPDDMTADRIILKIPLSAENAIATETAVDSAPPETMTAEVQPAVAAETVSETPVATVQAEQQTAEAAANVPDTAANVPNTVPGTAKSATATTPATNATQPTANQQQINKDYDAALKQYGALEKGETPAQNIAVPKKIDDERTVSRGQRTFAEAYTEEMVSPEDTKRRVMSGNATYIAQTNAEQIQNAQETIASEGIDEATKQWEASIYDGRIPNAKEMALGICLLDEAVKRGDVAAQDRLSAEFAFAATSAGQTVQASRILKELSGAAGIYYLKKVENKINSQIGGKGKSVSINPDLMTAYSKAKTSEERFAIAQEIKADLAKQIPFTGRDFLNALRYMNMLSNTKTAVTNVSGNLATVPLIAAKDAFAAVVERVAHVKDKRHSGILKKEYLDYAKSYAKNNVKMPEGGRFSTSLGELQRMRPAFGYSKWAKPLNTLYGGVMKMQEIGDAVFKSPYFTRAMAGYLQAKKVDLKNVSKEVLAKAEDYATERMLENLYQDTNTFVRALNSLANRKVLGWPTRIVMPFIRTAANITKFSVEYNPIGSVVNTVYQANKHGWSSSQVVESAAKGLAGSLPTALGFILRNAGILTLSLGDDPEDEMLRLKGYQEYSIRIGDKSYSLSWAGPMASLLMFGGFLADAVDGGMTLEEIGDAGMGTLEVLTDLGVFSGVVDLIDAYSYAQGDTAVAKILDYGKEAAITIGGNYVNQLVKPSFTAAIARTIDPTRRSTVTDPDSPVPESMQYQLYKIRNGTPFLSKTAPAYTDEFGQTQTDSHWNAFIENLVVPGYINDIKDNDPVLNAIEEVFVATGSKDKALIPEKASRSFSESSAKHKLNGDDYARLNEKYGSIIYDTVLKMEQTEEWQTTDALIRSAMLKDLYNYADNAARIDFVTMSPFSETWQKEAYKSGDVAGTILGRAEKYAQTVYGELYGNDLIDNALVDDWDTVQNHWAHLTTAYPYGAGLSEKQARNRIETEMRTKLQGGEANITPEELDAVETLYYLGMVNESFYKEVTAQ